MYLICVCNNDISSCRGGLICLFWVHFLLSCPKRQAQTWLSNTEIGEGVRGLAKSTWKFLESLYIWLSKQMYGGEIWYPLVVQTVSHVECKGSRWRYMQIWPGMSQSSKQPCLHWLTEIAVVTTSAMIKFCLLGEWSQTVSYQELKLLILYRTRTRVDFMHFGKLMWRPGTHFFLL